VVVVWSYFFPLLVAIGGARLVKTLLSPRKTTLRAMLKVREIVLPERELAKSREPRIVQLIMDILPKIEGIFDLEQLILRDLRIINGMMGIKTRPEHELALFIAHGLLGAIPILMVPFLTRFYGYLALYPVAVVVLIIRKYQKYKARYVQWQREIIRDLPDLIDKLRISFASGRDYLSAFIQARDSSGPKMKKMIDKLINDLQCMRPTQALDIFADSLKMPAVTKFTSAVKIALEYGYDSAESYFQTIEADILEVRRVAIEELTKSKPEKVYQLYLLLLSLAVGALVLKGWEIFSQVSRIF